jgi:hypothetical protein
MPFREVEEEFVTTTMAAREDTLPIQACSDPAAEYQI